MIFPKETEKIEKVTVSQQFENNVIIKRKRKRRWFYYFMCITISFIISRVLLIVFSVSNFDFKNYVLYQVSYNTKRPHSIYLEAVHNNAFSPLNIQILEGVVSLYSSTQDSKNRELMAEIHIPLIDVVKYQTLQFKGDIVWKNIRPKAIYSCLKHKKNIGVHFTGNIWFRFCYVKFKKSHSQDVTFTHPFFSKSTEEKNAPLNIKKVQFYNLNETVQIDVELELCNIMIPKFLNVKSEEFTLNFEGDLPFQITFYEQRIKDGRFSFPINLKVNFLKKDFNIYRAALWKYLRRDSLLWSLSAIDILHNYDKQFIDSYLINIGDSFCDNTVAKSKSKKKIVESPRFLLRDVRGTKNYLEGMIYIETFLFPYININTAFEYKNCYKNFIIKNGSTVFAKIGFEAVNSREFVKIKFRLTFQNFSEFVECLFVGKEAIVLFDETTDGFFEGLYLKLDGGELYLISERDYILLYKKGSVNKPFPFSISLDHQVQAQDNTIAVSSKINFNKRNDSESDLFLSLMVPDFSFELLGDNVRFEVYVLSAELVFYGNGMIDGSLLTSMEININKNIKNFVELHDMFSEVIVLRFSDYCKWILPRADENQKKLELFSLQDLSVSLEKVVSFDPPRVGIRLCNTLRSPSNMQGLCIFNHFKLFKGPFVRLVFSGAEYVRNDHIILLEDMFFDLNYHNGDLKLFIDDCFFGVSLFSTQEISILISNLFRAGMDQNMLGNIVGLFLNKVLDAKNDQSNNVIDSAMLCCIKVDSLGDSDALSTNVTLTVGLKKEILSSLKIGQLNFTNFDLNYMNESKRGIAFVYIEKGYIENYDCIIVKLHLTDGFLDESDGGFLTACFNNKYKKCKTEDSECELTKTQLLKIINSFLTPLFAKDKKEDHSYVQLTNIILDARESTIDLGGFVKGKNIIFEIENFGLRDFIRYTINNLLSKLFYCLPNKLSLSVNSEQIELLSFKNLEFVKPGNKPFGPLSDILSFTICNVNSKREYEMVDPSIQIYESEAIKIVQKKYSLLKKRWIEIVSKTSFQDIVDKAKLKKFLIEQSNLKDLDDLCYQKFGVEEIRKLKKQLFKLLFVEKDTYSLILKVDLYCRTDSCNFNLQKIRFSSPLINVLMKIIKPALPKARGIPFIGDPIPISFFGISKKLGVNLCVISPSDLRCKFKCRDLVLLDDATIPSFCTYDGYINISWSNSVSIRIIRAFSCFFSQESPFEITLSNKKQKILYKINAHFEAIKFYVAVFIKVVGKVFDFTTSIIQDSSAAAYNSLLGQTVKKLVVSLYSGFSSGFKWFFELFGIAKRHQECQRV